MKKISLKNLSGTQILTKEELKGIFGGEAGGPAFQCELTNGLTVDCYTATALECIEILAGENQEVGGCWGTTPV